MAAVGGLDPAAGRRSTQLAFEEIHRRRTDEAGDELVVRMIVKLERRAHLLDDAVMHHDDLVGHGHGLDLVVGDIDRRGLEPLMQFLDLGAHGDAQLGIEIRQRLVEQEHLRIAHDGAAHGDALALTAGQLPGITVEQARVRPRISAARLTCWSISLWVGAAQLERKAHVLRRPSYADTARSSGTPWRCRALSAARR